MKVQTLPLCLLFAAGAAFADDAAMLTCRALPDTGARLACYDAIPLAGAPRQASTPLAATPLPATPLPATPLPATPLSAAPAGPAVQTAEQRFGLEQVRSAAKPADEPKSIESSIEGNFSGWGPSTLFKLANGQVWRVVDGSSADLAPNTHQQVRIVRNLFGTTFLEVAGSNNSAKVRRVR